MRLLKPYLTLLFFTIYGISTSIANPKKIPIVYISGQVLYKKTNKPVTPGDLISTKTQLKFTTEGAFLLGILEGHVIKLTQFNYNNGKLNKKNESICSQNRKNIPLSDSALFNPLYLIVDTLLYFLPNQFIPVNKKDFQLKDNNFLILQLEKTNGSYTRKVSFSNESIVLNKPSYFKQDSSIQHTLIKIIHYNSDKDDYQLLYTYYPHLISKTELEQILASTYTILIQFFPNQDTLIERLQHEIQAELTGECIQKNH